MDIQLIKKRNSIDKRLKVHDLWLLLVPSLRRELHKYLHHKMLEVVFHSFANCPILLKTKKKSWFWMQSFSYEWIWEEFSKQSWTYSEVCFLLCFCGSKSFNSKLFINMYFLSLLRMPLIYVWAKIHDCVYVNVILTFGWVVNLFSTRESDLQPNKMEKHSAQNQKCSS